jgi:hypothetical protein
LDKVAIQLGLKNMDDWYKVKLVDVRRLGGNSLTLRYGGSLIYTLQSVYPDFEWDVLKFERVPRRYWNSETNVRNFLHNFSSERKIQNNKDWSLIRMSDFASSRGGYQVVRQNGGLNKLLKKFIPGYIPLNNCKGLSKLKTQSYLYKMLNTIFPNQNMIMNFRHTELEFQKSERKMELDIFIPFLAIAFEYQKKK